MVMRNALRAAVLVVPLVMACMLVEHAAAQDTVLSASVDRSTVRANESFTYLIRAEGAGVRGEPDLSPLSTEFELLPNPPPQRSERREWNTSGVFSHVVEWRYSLLANSTGTLTLPAVRVGGAMTNPVTIEVRPVEPTGDGAASDIFLELDSEPAKVYTQAQAIVTVRLFVGVRTGRATLSDPPIAGGEAIVEKLRDDAQYRTQRGGRAYDVLERRYAVFPQQPGTLTIGPVTFEAPVEPNRSLARVERYRSGSIELEVLPAVAAPPQLSGATWLPARSVTIAETWSDPNDAAVVGEPRTRTIVVEAEGVLDTQLPELVLEPQPGIRQYAEQPELERELTQQGLKSRLTMRYAVIAQSPGSVELPSVELPWWNVATESWDIAALPARTLDVAPNPTSVVVPPAEPADEIVVVPSIPPVETVAGFWPVLTAVLALGWAATALAWWRVSARAASGGASRAGATGASSSIARAQSERLVLRDLRVACSRHDAPAARQGLLDWAQAKFEDPPRSLGALAARLPERVARPVLDLEAHLYGSAGPQWSGDALAEALGELAQSATPQPRQPRDPLLPLYR